MRKPLAAFSVVLFVAVCGLYYWADRLPLIVWAADVHAVRGSINCGFVSNSDAGTGNDHAAISCAQSATQQKSPFYVIFSGHGIDAQISSALISDGNGKAIELFYATGMVEHRGLTKHPCDVPLKLVIAERSPYGFSHLHCAPWPPPADRLSRDFLLW